MFFSPPRLSPASPVHRIPAAQLQPAATHRDRAGHRQRRLFLRAGSPIRRTTRATWPTSLRGAGFEVIVKTDADQRGMKDAIQSFGSCAQGQGRRRPVVLRRPRRAVERRELHPADRRGLRQRGRSQAQRGHRGGGGRRHVGGAQRPQHRRARRLPRQSAAGQRSDARAVAHRFELEPVRVVLDLAGRGCARRRRPQQPLRQASDARDRHAEHRASRTRSSARSRASIRRPSGKQQPWISSSFFGDFMFQPDGSPGRRHRSAAGAAGRRSRHSAAHDAERCSCPAPRRAGRRLSRQRHQPERHPLSRHGRADGRGQSVPLHLVDRPSRSTPASASSPGRMLVVNWGQTKPVIYSFAHGDNLDGEWADGSATEKLTHVARAACDADAAAGGRSTASTARNPERQRAIAARSRSRARRDRYQLRLARRLSRAIAAPARSMAMSSPSNWGSTTAGRLCARADDGELAAALWIAARPVGRGTRRRRDR